MRKLPSPEPKPATEPRPGIKDPEYVRQVALIFAAEGIAGDHLRSWIHPDDRLLGDLADAIDALAAEGLDRAACRAMIGMDPLPADGDR